MGIKAVAAGIKAFSQNHRALFRALIALAALLLIARTSTIFIGDLAAGVVRYDIYWLFLYVPLVVILTPLSLYAPRFLANISILGLMALSAAIILWYASTHFLMLLIFGLPPLYLLVCLPALLRSPDTTVKGPWLTQLFHVGVFTGWLCLTIAYAHLLDYAYTTEPMRYISNYWRAVFALLLILFIPVVGTAAFGQHTLYHNRKFLIIPLLTLLLYNLGLLALYASFSEDFSGEGSLGLLLLVIYGNLFYVVTSVGYAVYISGRPPDATSKTANGPLVQ